MKDVGERFHFYCAAPVESLCRVSQGAELLLHAGCFELHARSAACEGLNPSHAAGDVRGK